MKLYLTGGAVRDYLLGRKGKTDLDFAVEAESYEAMRTELVNERGLHVWEERPEFVTLRGRLPMAPGVETFGGLVAPRASAAVDADFTLCRAEAMYSDRRHPDTVTPASLFVDLGRRDFTMNAVAVSEDGDWFDPHGGAWDVERQLLRCVGHPKDRFNEDPLRMLRAVRFAVTLGLDLDHSVQDAMRERAHLLSPATVKVERVHDELNKAMRGDWSRTLILLSANNLTAYLQRYPSLWFKATTESR